jgi:FKBP-type peptidyl-prolyl cis-trans isomerase
VKTATFALVLFLVACGKTPANGQDAKPGEPAKPADAPPPADKPQMKVDVLTKGEGREVKQGDIVLAHLTLTTVADGRSLQDTRKSGDPQAVPVGMECTIPSLDQMVQKMRLGDRWKGSGTARSVFGENARVPCAPDAEISLDVEIVGFVEIKREVVASGAGATPRRGDAVIVHYTGTLTDGTKFDSSRDRDEPFVFNVGEGAVIQGWDVTVLQMKPGDRWKVTIPWQLAYGAQGSPPKIPAKADLVFDIERLPPPEIKTEVLAEGKGEPAKRGERVFLHAVVSLPDGTKLDDSRERGEPLDLVVGGTRLFPGWDMVVGKLRLGDRVKATVPWTLAFGAQGRPPKIPPKSDVLLDLERVSEPVAPEMKHDVIAEGKGPVCRAGQTVKVHYTGTLTNGTQFDSSRDRGQPFEFQLGAHQVIRGWDIAVSQMRVGDRWKVTIPWALAYGARGSPPTIPPKADLVFDIEVLDAK